MADSFASRVPWMIGSVLVTLGLYVGVELTTNNKDTKENFYNVTLTCENTPHGLAVFDYKNRISVKAKGNADVLKNFDPSVLKGFIDLTTGVVGKKLYSVSVQGLPLGVRFDVPPVSVTLESIESKQIPVRVSVLGSLPTTSGLMLDSTDMQPSTILAVGPRSKLQSVAYAGAYLRLPSVELNKPYRSQLQLYVLDKDGNPFPADSQVHPDPSEVTLLPRLSAVPSNRLVLVVPRFRGEPAPPNVVNSYEVMPNQVSVSGDGQKLSHTTQIGTELIDIGGLRSDHTFRVRLIVPSGLQIGQVDRTVRVRVNLRSEPSLGSRVNPNGSPTQHQPPLGPSQ